MRIHEPFIDPLARRLAGGRVTPDMLTIASVAPAVAAGISAAAGWFVAASLLFAVSGLLDLLDGALARADNRQTRFGALLDSSLDRIADACLPIGLVVFYAPYGVWAAVPALALLASLWISYIRARALSLDLQLPRLWMRREDRFIALLAALLFSPWVWPSASVPAVLVLVVLALVAGMGLVAGTMALVHAARIAAQAPRSQ